MSLPRVIADTPLPPSVQKLLAGNVEVLPWQAGLQGTDEAIEGIFVYSHPAVDGPLLDRLPAVRIISNHGVGVDHIDVHAAAARGVPVANTPGCLDAAVADLAFALLLAAARRVVEGDRYARGPEFTVFDPNYMLGRDVHGGTLGIVGLGNIGTQVARRAAAFDMQIVYHNRRRRPEAEQQFGARYLPLGELLETADFVVLIVPLTDQTRGMIGRAELDRMKPTATLVNIARGPVVDTDAVTDALRERKIYAAALDVTDPEPLPRDHPLLALESLTITPHLGSATEQTRRRMAELAVENLLRGLRGEPVLHKVKR